AAGLKYNRFHTTALCSPTRAALLTGRNHHSAGMGGITEIATGAPGYSSVLPNTISPLARTLKLNGYSTVQFGTFHEVPVWAASHVPKESADKCKGNFDQRWGKPRGETVARQKKLGVIPADCQLAGSHTGIPASNEMPEALKPILPRQMEVYAGFMEYTAHHV